MQHDDQRHRLATVTARDVELVGAASVLAAECRRRERAARCVRRWLAAEQRIEALEGGVGIGWSPPADRADPVGILIEQGKSRIQEPETGRLGHLASASREDRAMPGASAVGPFRPIGRQAGRLCAPHP